MGSSQVHLERLLYVVDFILFASLIIGSIIFLRSILNHGAEELKREEDKVFAEIMLPISRIVNLLSEEELREFDDDILDALEEGLDYVIIVVRKYAWRNGIKVDPAETEVMYKYIRRERMTDTEKALLASIEDEAQNVLIYPGGLVICKPARDNKV